MTRSIWTRIMILVALLSFSQMGCKATKTLSSATQMMNLLGGNANLSTLQSLMKGVDLGSMLGGKDVPFTLLAPSNDAFKNLPGDVLTSLTNPGNADQLQKVLSNHIIPGKMSASDFVGKDALSSLDGKSLPITGSGDDLMIDGAKIIGKNMDAGNGMVQMIDKVLLP
ncbi:fasciclin domain-containing protein [Pontibacter sp. G13]|uniref:fasciclin domain-containing protein n=1 Tax=Pontibacter sp. G13 TaxID=3074898 RepID=UPI00288BF329|nr:fasciclin domain-containing protein [Pontibacter sp. G13]WNJ18702.1 fasciclin domain-containing protein [Pontibacter sp. G13]